MANDTPRYGSRNDDEARRYSDDAETTDEQRTRPSFLDSSYADEPEVADRSSYSSDPYERRTGTQSGRLSSLEGLRPSRYDNDDTAAPARDTYSSSPLRDNGAERTDAPADIDRFKPSTSSFGTQDGGQRNPLLKPNTAMRRFSWEEDDTPKPAERTAAPLRDYEPPRYESRNPRLDEMSPDPETPSYSSDRNSDARYRTPAPGYTSRAQAPDAAAERQYGYGDNYASTPYADAPYDDAPRDYDAYDDTPYQGAHARELADVDQEYAREYQYDADGAESRHTYGDYDPEFQHYEQPYGEHQRPRRRRGPFLLVGSLVGVAVIAGGLIFAYQALQGGDEKTIPVVTVDETPIKVEPQTPQPQVQEQPR